MSNPREAFESALVAQRVADRVAAAKVFPVGAAVLIDGKQKAKVVQAFPEGSSSFAFPHYKVNIVGGDKNVAVKMDRVGVKPASGSKSANERRR